jgi:hypothetical protein
MHELIGPGKQETHAAAARSNFPMRFQCGIFYYETRIISKGNDGYIGIGFCAASNKLERLPGNKQKLCMQVDESNAFFFFFIKVGILILGDIMETMDIHSLDLVVERIMDLVFPLVM